jgi:hypothetical protein
VISVPDWSIESRSKPVVCLTTPLLRSLSTADRSLVQKIAAGLDSPRDSTGQTCHQPNLAGDWLNAPLPSWLNRWRKGSLPRMVDCKNFPCRSSTTGASLKDACNKNMFSIEAALNIKNQAVRDSCLFFSTAGFGKPATISKKQRVETKRRSKYCKRRLNSRCRLALQNPVGVREKGCSISLKFTKRTIENYSCKPWVWTIDSPHFHPVCFCTSGSGSSYTNIPTTLFSY